MRVLASTALALSLTFLVAPLTHAANIEGSDGINSIGYLPCASQDGINMSDCGFEILRKEDGSFTLRILMPGGMTRYLYGQNGTITSTDSTGSLASKRLANKTIVHIRPEERFEVSNELIDSK